MPIFSYTATKNGKTLHGNLETTDKDSALVSLHKQGMQPLSVKMVSTKSAKHRRGHVRQRDLVIFTRQLSTLVSAGVPLTRSLVTLQSQSENKYFKTVIGGVTRDVEGGLSLAESLKKYPNVFNDVYVNMVAAGESGFFFFYNKTRLAEQVEKDATIRKKIKSASAYPAVIFGITIIAFFGIMIFVIPKLGKIIKDLGGPDAQLPIYTQIMLNLSTFLQENAVLIIGLTVIGIYLLRRYIKTPKGKYKFHSLLLRTPVIKTVVTKIAIARFARTFASLMSAGVGVLDALEVTGGAIGNKVIEAELKEAAKQVKNGKQLSEPLSQSEHFPPIIGQMLAVGEETGQIDSVLVKVADFYEEEVDAVIDGLSSLIEPLMIIVLGSVVGLIAASVMGPITSLSQNVSNN